LNILCHSIAFKLFNPTFFQTIYRNNEIGEEGAKNLGAGLLNLKGLTYLLL
jgi:hypothetical protein